MARPAESRKPELQADLIAGLIEQHDRSRFDVVGISFGPDDGSEMRRRLTSAFHQFFDVQGMSDHAAAALLTKLDIDIAVDLKGYTKGYRSELLRGRPAPVGVEKGRCHRTLCLPDRP